MHTVDAGSIKAPCRCGRSARTGLRKSAGAFGKGPAEIHGGPSVAGFLRAGARSMGGFRKSAGPTGDRAAREEAETTRPPGGRLPPGRSLINRCPTLFNEDRRRTDLRFPAGLSPTSPGFIPIARLLIKKLSSIKQEVCRCFSLCGKGYLLMRDTGQYRARLFAEAA